MNIQQPHIFTHEEVLLRLQNYSSHPFAAVDPNATQQNFNMQGSFNTQTAKAIADIVQRLEALEWVSEHYPEVLHQYSASKKWEAAFDRGPVCDEQTK